VSVGATGFVAVIWNPDAVPETSPTKENSAMSMPMWEVKMGRPGGGSGTFVVYVHAGTPDQARRSAEAQNPGYKAQAVRRA